ncbi:class I SAM-dependent methyltransferase [Antarctobacter heliothermus]|nr:class I SAM-dependent methyltransferase [Antarctobacter heliothermus]
MVKDSSIEAAFEEAQENYFGEDSAIFQVTLSPFEAEVLRKRTNVLRTYLPTKGTILEVGPGGGAVLGWLIAQGHTPTAVEHSPSLSKHLATHYDITVKSGEFEALDLGKDIFDAFCSFHVIEHVRDPLAHLQNAFDIVRPGGMAFVATPNADSWEQRIPGNLSPNYDSAHLRVFSQASLYKLADEVGWQIEQTKTPEFTMGWLRVLSKAVRRFKGEHEESTAGKYAGGAPGKTRILFRTAHILSWPIRALQASLGGGNELFFVLRKPHVTSTETRGTDV